MPTFYEDVLQSLGVLQRPEVKEEFEELLVGWRRFFAATSTVAQDFQQLADLTVKLTGLAGAPDRDAELELMKVASQNPVLGPALVLAALPATTSRWYGRFWQGLYTEEQKNAPAVTGTDVLLSGPYASWKIKQLPAPGGSEKRKYLIFSDVHRDDAADKRRPLERGTTNHFSPDRRDFSEDAAPGKRNVHDNAELFKKILAHYAPRRDYTILEGGDCEELWFIRSVDPDTNVAPYPLKADGSLDVARKLEKVIDSHREIYELLGQLHAEGRYFRIQGNHDSFVRKNRAGGDAVLDVLRTAMMGAASPLPAPFEIYDACVIPGVKTMCEHSALDVLRQAWDYKQKSKTWTKQQRRAKQDELVAELVKAHFGLDSAAYQDTAKMVVMHGHQFDFWNCEGNEILGMLISNTVATYLDRNMDPILDLRGVALQGNPLVDFEDLFDGLPVLGTWPEGSAAVARAHRLQHTPRGERALEDGLFFYESIPALWAAFGIALTGKDGSGKDLTPADTRSSPLDLRSYDGIREYLRRHHLHHVCLGHTHLPHSQPNFTLANAAALLPPPLSWMLLLLKAILPGVLEPTFKTMYSNSGTAGWNQGVVWATYIDETGQSRLVYWTDTTPPDKPEVMDWELTPLEAEIKNNLGAALDLALMGPRAEILQNTADILQRIKERLERMNVAADALTTALSRSMVLPVHVLALALVERAERYRPDRVLNEIGKKLLETAKGVANEVKRRAAGVVRKAVDEAVDELKRELDKLRSFTFDVFLSMKRRMIHGFSPADLDDFDVLSIRAPIAAPAKAALERYQKLLVTAAKAGESPRTLLDAALHRAGIALAIFDGFPRAMPFFTTQIQASNHAARVQGSEHPVLHSLLSTLWMFPVAGEKVEVGGVAMWSRFTLEEQKEGTFAVLKVTLARASAPEPQPKDQGYPRELLMS